MKKLLILLPLLLAAAPQPSATLYLDNPDPSFGETVNLSFEIHGRLKHHDAVYPELVCYEDRGLSPIYVEGRDYSFQLGTSPDADYDGWVSGHAYCDMYLYVYHYNAQGDFLGYDELAELEFYVSG